MSARARKPRKDQARPSRADLKRPFDPGILERAEKIAAQYQIVLEFEDGRYYGRGLELPFAMDDGATPDECVSNTRRALTVSVAAMLEDGQAPPPPASQGVRTEQINVRLTADEKTRLQELARQRGFNRLSEYIREKALTG